MNDQPMSEDYLNEPICIRCKINPQRESEDVCTECYDEEWLIGTYEGIDRD